MPIGDKSPSKKKSGGLFRRQDKKTPDPAPLPSPDTTSLRKYVTMPEMGSLAGRAPLAPAVELPKLKQETPVTRSASPAPRRQASAPRGPQVSMTRKAPTTRSDAYETMKASNFGLPTRRPSATPAPAPTRTSTPAPKAPVRGYGEGRSLSRMEIDSVMTSQYGTATAKAYRPTSTPKAADKTPMAPRVPTASASSAPMRRTPASDFASLGSSFYNSLSKKK